MLRPAAETISDALSDNVITRNPIHHCRAIQRSTIDRWTNLLSTQIKKTNPKDQGEKQTKS